MTEAARAGRLFDTVLFDLDGTLTDPAVGITRSVAYALEQLGRPPLAAGELLRFIGPPIQEGFADVAGIATADVDRAVTAYRDYFAVTGIFENELYVGIVDVLQQLLGRGVRLAVATSKPTVFARRIVQHFAIAEFFEVVGGAELDGSRRHKADVIAHVLASLGEDTGRVVMVGDREHDVLGAAVHGLPCIGVGWGYGSELELRNAGALAVVARVDDLAEFLLEESIGDVTGQTDVPG